MRETLLSDETSASRGTTGWLELANPDAASFAPWISAITTEAPSSARRRTIASPMPVAPPVTIATRSFSLMAPSPRSRSRIELAQPADARLLRLTPRRRPVELQFDQPLEPSSLQEAQHGREVDLAGPRLQPPRRVGELDDGNRIPGRLEMRDQVAVHGLDMSGVEDQAHRWTVHGGDNVVGGVDVM